MNYKVDDHVTVAMLFNETYEAHNKYIAASDGPYVPYGVFLSCCKFVFNLKLNQWELVVED